MREKGPELLLAGTLLLVTIAGLVVACDRPAPPGLEFQRLTGGLGLGTATDLDRCAAEFDPRLDPACAWRLEPLPGASLFCPSHAGER